MTHILIVEANYYNDITEELYQGVIEVLEENNFSYGRIAVPGAFEIPATISMINQAQDDDLMPFEQEITGYIALGCVIRGETSHYDVICNETARAIQNLATKKHIPIGFGVLTCENMDQATARADRKQKNKGAEAAIACLSMIEIYQNCFEEI